MSLIENCLNYIRGQEAKSKDVIDDLEQGERTDYTHDASLLLRKKKLCLDRDFLFQKHKLEGLSAFEIARQLGCSRSTVSKYISLHGIPANNLTRRETGAMVFGYRNYGGKAIEVNRDQEVIGLIKKLKDNGSSYQRICDELNSKGFKTKHNLGKWYPKTVRQILIRCNKSNFLNLD